MSLANVKKGDKVIMRLFTGAFSGVKEVEKADKNFIYFTTGKGMSKFSRKTGKMVEPAPKNETYANFIEEYDEEVEAEEMAKKEKARANRAKKKKAEKAAAKKKPVVAEPEDDEDIDEDDIDEDEEDEAPAKKKAVKKVAKKKVAKKAKAEEDDEDYEEVD